MSEEAQQAEGERGATGQGADAPRSPIDPRSPQEPLPLAAFESFMLADDTPEHPMCFIVELWLRGTLDRPAFMEAIQMAQRRHPLFASLIDADANGGPVWVATDQRPLVDWDTEGQPCASPRGDAIDPRSEVGLRVWIRMAEGRTRVLMQFHHAVCDGLGAFLFIEDVLAAYHCLVVRPGIEPELRPLDPAQLSIRGSVPMPPPDPQATSVSLRERIRGMALGAVEVVRTLTGWPDPVAVPTATKLSALRSFLDYHTEQLDQEEFRRLRRAATAAGVALNELLMRDLFLTLRDWNREFGEWSNRSRLRIMMPTNLRGKGEEQMPAANRISYNFLTRSARELEQPDELLASVRHDTQFILKANMSRNFISAITAARRFQKPLLKVLGRRCLATVVLTNAGDPTRRFAFRFPREHGEVVAGNVVIEKMTGVPPLRPHTRAVFSASPMAGKLNVCGKADPNLFTSEQSRELLERFVARLRESAGGRMKDEG